MGGSATAAECRRAPRWLAGLVAVGIFAVLLLTAGVAVGRVRSAPREELAGARAMDRFLRCLEGRVARAVTPNERVYVASGPGGQSELSYQRLVEMLSSHARVVASSGEAHVAIELVEDSNGEGCMGVTVLVRPAGAR